MGTVVMHPAAAPPMAGRPAGTNPLYADLVEALQRFRLAVGFLRQLPVRPDSVLLAYLIGRLDRTLARLDAALVAPQPDLAALQAACQDTTDLLPLLGYLKQDFVPTRAARRPPATGA